MIALVRHPPVRAVGRCYGRLDVPLEDPASAGRLASQIAPFLPRPSFTGEGRPRAETWTVWTSPAQRCRLVAEAVGPHRVDERLQELCFGAWEGCTWDDVPRASLDEWAAAPWTFAPPDGESGASLVARIRSFVAAWEGGNHVVITHGGPLKILTALLRHAPIDLLAPAPPPGSITLVQTA